MTKKVLVINLGWEQEPLLDKLTEFDCELYGVHYDEEYYKKPAYREVLISDLRNLEKLLAFAERIKPDAVIADECDYSYFAQAVIAEKFDLSGPGVKAAHIATNKYLQRKAASKQNILVPSYRLCTAVEDVKHFVQSNGGYPIILKPVDNRGSFGAHRIDSESEIEAAYYDALIHSNARLVIAENFIEGTHLTIDGYIFKDRGPKTLALATNKKHPAKKGLINEEIIYPGSLFPPTYQACTELAEKTARKFGYTFGFFHGEYIVEETTGKIYLTEMANRGGGVHISNIAVPHFCGIDLQRIYVLDALGVPNIAPFEFVQTPTMLKFFVLPELVGKRVKKISGIADQDLKDVLKLRVWVKEGQQVEDILNGARRHGMIIVTNQDKAQLSKIAEDGIKHLMIEAE